ncbi:putative T7SS-secreted protein [Nocardioides sp.]|uniref:putative T7SS-secreted protein n=1 Tax=Nocardioides sp. TaxID=35761 RepID=UPI00272779D1|nr:hypothetical protein [Nocardioides sp.]MDO9457866.1 hypothetical protein [Nocardioides sp.]
MYGDTEVLRRRVDQLREQAVDVRGLADQLVARTESTGWAGRAADSMRVRVTERATHLRGAAAQHETAADALEKHVHEVESLQESIADAERQATDLVAEARTRMADVDRRNADAGAGVRVEPDPDDVTLCAFEPPPSGHRDWLTVELPGL